MFLMEGRIYDVEDILSSIVIVFWGILYAQYYAHRDISSLSDSFSHLGIDHKGLNVYGQSSPTT